MANYLDYFIHTSGIAFGQVYSSGREGMSEREKFEKWAFDNNVTNLYPISFGAAWAAWQAALSTRKPCGYAVVDSEGKPLRSFRKSYVDEAHKFVKFFNENDIVGNPFRVVELFYEDSES